MRQLKPYAALLLATAIGSTAQAESPSDFDIVGKWLCSGETGDTVHNFIWRIVIKYDADLTYKSSTQMWIEVEQNGEIRTKIRTQTAGRGTYSFDGSTLSSVQTSRDFLDVKFEVSKGHSPKEVLEFEANMENSLSQEPLLQKVSKATVLSETKFTTQTSPGDVLITCVRPGAFVS